MNILVIGNGFDLAHGLPTTYKDFLKYTREFKYEMEEESTDIHYGVKKKSEFTDHLLNMIKQSSENEYIKGIKEELGKYVIGNLWLEYFYMAEISEGWIDFEKEISQVVKEMDEAIQNDDKLTTLKFYNKSVSVFGKRKRKAPSKIAELKEYCLQDLNELIRCLEIYLSYYVEEIEIESKLADIERLPYLDKVLSFNYTNTFKKMYDDKGSYVEYDYIHGKADIGNSIETNNMVLGIDEYLKGEERNENLEFVEFKKFYQRIHKETGCKYRNWVDEIRSNKKITELNIEKIDEENKATRIEADYHKLFIFGHSLDITDKDVLRDLILNDNVQTTIFYMDKKDYGRKIMNLVKVIGQDELIRRTGGATKTITFKKIEGDTSQDD